MDRRKSMEEGGNGNSCSWRRRRRRGKTVTCSHIKHHIPVYGRSICTESTCKTEVYKSPTDCRCPSTTIALSSELQGTLPGP
ncbi:unnamed protein product [Calypogeia fissa]